MAHVPTPNTVRVCLRYTQNGQQTCNVFHVDVGVDPTESTLRDVADVFKLWWDTDMQTAVTAGTTLDAVEVVDVSADDQEGIVDTTGLPLNGTHIGANMPNNVTLCVKLATGLTGRSRRGRKYIVGIPDSVIEGPGQEVTPAYRDAIKAIFESLLANLATAGFQWVVNSTVTGGIERLTGLNTPITDIAVDDTLDSMRRRLPGRGS